MDNYSKITVITDAGVRFADIHNSGDRSRGYSTGAAVLIDDISGRVIGEHSGYFGELSVGEAEYMALIFGLTYALEASKGIVAVWSDSQFVVQQLKGEARVKGENIKKLYFKAKELERNFLKVRYFHHNRTSFLAKKAHNLTEEEYRKHGV